MASTVYIARARAIGGRSGFVRGESEAMKLDIAVPGSVKAKPDSTNPEELFACGLAASFCGALEEAARVRNMQMSEALLEAEVHLLQEQLARSLSCVLHITIAGMSHAKAAELVAQAYRSCPYARAMRGNVRMTIHINNQLLLKAA